MNPIILALPELLGQIISVIKLVSLGKQVSEADFDLLVAKVDEITKLIDAQDAEWRKNNAS